MQRSGNPLYRSLLWLFDWFTLNLVFFIVGSFFTDINIYGQRAYIHYFYVLNLVWLASAYVTALYQYREWPEVVSFLKMTIKTLLLSTFIILIFVVAYKYPFSRLFIFSTITSFGVALVVNRIIIHFLMLTACSRFTRNVVVIGRNDASRKLISYFNDNMRFVRVVGWFDPVSREQTEVNNLMAVGVGSQANVVRKYYYAGETGGGSLSGFLKGIRGDGGYDKEYHSPEEDTEGLMRYHGLDHCLNFVREHDVAEIYCTISPEEDPGLYELAYRAEENFIHFKFVPDYSHFARKTVLVSQVEDLPILSLRRQPLEEVANRIMKRLLDVCLSIGVIVFFLSWLTPLLAVLIKLDSRGPVFFRQLRSGRNNKPFWCIKFRTLKQNDEADRKQVTRNDQRVTKLGKVLRKTNIDELPQFINVLVGHMSVVGPRPHMLKHTEEFVALHDKYMIRHFVKPGVTGLAQIKGYRGEIRHPELLKKRVEFDLHYLENWSLTEDIRIILATIFVSFRGDANAY